MVDSEDLCPAVRAAKVIGSEWKLIVIRYLMEGDMRFSELQRAIPGITPKTLSRTLRDLEGDGIASREVVGSRPPAVVYRLTERGWALAPVIEGLKEWGSIHLSPAGPPRRSPSEGST